VFLKQNDDLIEIYCFKMTKNKIDKTNCCNACRKNQPEACFHLFPRCGLKPKTLFPEINASLTFFVIIENFTKNSKHGCYDLLKKYIRAKTKILVDSLSLLIYCQKKPC
jgi:hypothetical protein